jgi:hypothetical protein
MRWYWVHVGEESAADGSVTLVMIIPTQFFVILLHSLLSVQYLYIVIAGTIKFEHYHSFNHRVSHAFLTAICVLHASFISSFILSSQ